MNQQILKATHAGSLDIGNTSIKCAVLDDGSRVITHSSFSSAIGRAGRERGGEGPSSEGLPSFISANNLKPFVSEKLEQLAMPIIYKPLNPTSGHKGKAYGYKAELLPEVCNTILSARDSGSLLPSQEHIAKQCELLIRGLAVVGIVALVDEATGYQKERERNELQKILEKYIAKELLPWIKTFPDEYYEELFRLRGWQYNPLSVKRPQLVGKLTNQIVYKKMPPGVLEELRMLNPVTENGHRKHRHHQHLTDEVGKMHLEKYLISLITLMRISPNWRIFEKHLERAFPSTQEKQLELFEDDFDDLDK
ncbi:P63C domain-containing protein [Laspinema sp. D1]|uniref:P63C domain-containing protein n=1 Tax=Laspinema palackyanum TaxID=3231601 RepID=UPI003483619A|nr:P63C domain-containing protein [Laspinema sp. D2b]